MFIAAPVIIKKGSIGQNVCWIVTWSQLLSRLRNNLTDFQICSRLLTPATESLANCTVSENNAHRIMLIQIQASCSGAPRTTFTSDQLATNSGLLPMAVLGFDNLLVLNDTELSKALYLQLEFYCSKRIQIRTSQSKGSTGWNMGGLQCDSSLSSGTHQVDRMHRILPNLEAHLSLWYLKFQLELNHILSAWLTFTFQAFPKVQTNTLVSVSSGS